MMDTSERYKSEVIFFDRRMKDTYLKKNSYTLNNMMNYQELFNKINQFKAVVNFFGDIEGKKILDLGCGIGWISLYFGRSKANVWCIDLSPKSIEVAKRFVRENGLDNYVTPMVMQAEKLKFTDEYFDFVFVNAALHHCDVKTTTKEIHRVLKKRGKAVMIEDLGYHPIMNFYRWMTPKKHTPDERALQIYDIDWIRGVFEMSQVYYYQLINFVDMKGKIGNFLGFTDEMLIKKIPKLKKYCRLIGIHLVK